MLLQGSPKRCCSLLRPPDFGEQPPTAIAGCPVVHHELPYHVPTASVERQSPLVAGNPSLCHKCSLPPPPPE